MASEWEVPLMPKGFVEAEVRRIWESVVQQVDVCTKLFFSLPAQDSGVWLYFLWKQAKIDEGFGHFLVEEIVHMI